MDAVCIFFAALFTFLWVGFALSPWGLWRNKEVLDVVEGAKDNDVLNQVTILIPARNEGEVMQQTLQSIAQQGPGARIIVIDDGSDDATVAKAHHAGSVNLRLIPGQPLPPGWGGKLWALEQGRQLVETPYTLLLDADIELGRGVIKALRERMQQQGIAFISLMAVPSMSSGWEKLLMPAFVYFFKILYPFRRVNSHRSNIAAAAGGCILMESRLLEQIGGFEFIKSAVIDDCSLARRVKSQGFEIWLGLTHSAKSVRGYHRLKEIWDMVARVRTVANPIQGLSSSLGFFAQR